MAGFIQKVSARIFFSGVPFHECDIIAVRDKANVFGVMLPGVDKTCLFCDPAGDFFGEVAQGESDAGQLLLCQHVQDITLILLFINGFF